MNGARSIGHCRAPEAELRVAPRRTGHPGRAQARAWLRKSRGERGQRGRLRMLGGTARKPQTIPPIVRMPCGRQASAQVSSWLELEM